MHVVFESLCRRESRANPERSCRCYSKQDISYVIHSTLYVVVINTIILPYKEFVNSLSRVNALRFLFIFKKINLLRDEIKIYPHVDTAIFYQEELYRHALRFAMQKSKIALIECSVSMSASTVNATRAYYNYSVSGQTNKRCALCTSCRCRNHRSGSARQFLRLRVIQKTHTENSVFRNPPEGVERGSPLSNSMPRLLYYSARDTHDMLCTERKVLPKNTQPQHHYYLFGFRTEDIATAHERSVLGASSFFGVRRRVVHTLCTQAVGKWMAYLTGIPFVFLRRVRFVCAVVLRHLAGIFFRT